MLSEKQLRNTCQDMIVTMNLQDGPANNKRPVVLEDNMTIKDYIGFIKDAMKWIAPTDDFSTDTLEVLEEIRGGKTDVPEKKVVIPDMEQEKPQDPPLTLSEEIDACERLKEAKEIALSYPEFKSIRGKLSSYKTVEDLKDELRFILMGKKETVIDKFEKEKVIVMDVDTVLKVKEQNNENIANIPDDILFGKVEDSDVISFGELIGNGTIEVERIITKAPFNALFNIDEKVLDAVTSNMLKNGYDSAFPVILWGEILIDGHTRLIASKASGIKEIPTLQKEFATQQEALEYAIHNQRDRRNIADSELLRCISIIDTPMSKSEATSKGGKKEKKEKVKPTHIVTAEALNISPTKVTDARKVLADETQREDVLSGKKTINQAVTEIREKKTKTEKMSKVDACCRVIKDCAGTEMFISDVLNEANELYGGSVGKTLDVVLEVLKSMEFVVVTVDSINIKPLN
jgi:hypothetical protein